jgi:16S rRNA U516 pseudouridylate synthase RsuA-like enzyme
MMEHAGHPVLKLKRIRFAGLELEGLEVGEYRYLTGREVEKLKKAGKISNIASLRTPSGAVRRQSFAG